MQSANINMSASGNPPENFELLEGYACFRPAGTVSLTVAVELVSQAIAHTRQHQIPKLLADSTGLIGFPPPGTVERYFLIHDWAAQAQGRVKFALIARPEMVDPERFGEMVAANVGLRGRVFTSEAEALAWLLDEQTR